MSKKVEDLKGNQQKLLELLKETKEVKEVIESSKAGTYANISEEAIFNGLLEMNLLHNDQNWRYRNRR